MRPNSTNPGSMDAGEHGLTRGTCFVARRLEVVAVAGLLWISWCALGAAGFCFVFFPFFFLFERPRPAANMRPACLIYLSASSKGIFVFWVFVLQLLYVSKGKWQLISIYLVPISSVCPAYKISSPKKTIT